MRTTKKFLWLLGVLVLATITSTLGTAFAIPQTQSEVDVPVDRLDPTNFEMPPRFPGLDAEEIYFQNTETTRTAALLPWSGLVYQSYRDGNWNIYRSNDDGSAEMRLTGHGGADIFPNYNRGLNRIVYSSYRNPDYEIVVMNGDGSGKTYLTQNDSDDVRPVWSPDGSKIAFESYRDGQAEIYVMNADGSAQTRLTFGGNFNGMPDWSPDGSKIAFVSARTGGYRIYVMNADGSNVQQLSTQPYSARPKWSPDGKKILYDADSDTNQWVDLWLMDADGSNQYSLYVYSSSPQRDFIANGWSPNGDYVVFTKVNYVAYLGQWYWRDANVYAIHNSSEVLLTHGGVDWMGNWQSADASAPLISLNDIPAISSSPIRLDVVMSDSGGAGLRSLDYEVKSGNGSWILWKEGAVPGNLPAYPGVAGQTYSLRVRARDNAFNVSGWSNSVVTTVESEVPESQVLPLPAYSRFDETVQLFWQGHDPGHSDISSYDVQYRLNGAGWQDWLQDVSEQTAVFDPNDIPGDLYEFRSRVTDAAQSTELWPDTPDTGTQLYTWGLHGRAYDNTHTPISEITFNAVPTVTAVLASDSSGQYDGYFISQANSYQLTWQKDGYGSPDTTNFESGPDQTLDVVLPPLDNIISNGGFETSPMSPNWQIAGSTFSLVSETHHTGQQSLLLGNEAYYSPPTTLLEGVYWWTNKLTKIDNNQTIHVIAINLDWSSFVYTSIAQDGTQTAPEFVYFDNDCALFDPAVGFPSDSQVTMKVTSDGVVHLAWVSYAANRTNGNDDYVCYTKRNGAGNWMPLSKTVAPYNSQSVIHIDDQGKVHVVWLPANHLYINIPKKVYYTFRSQSGSWSTPELFLESDERLDNILLVADSNGTTHVIWSSQDGAGPPNSTGHLYHRSRSNAGQWSPITQIYTSRLSASAFFSEASIAVDEQNVIHLFAKSHAAATYWQFRNGVWAEGITLGLSDYFNVPQMIVEGNGRIHVGWVNNGVGYYATSENGKGFVINQLPLPVFGYNFNFAIDSLGEAHFIWHEIVNYTTTKSYYAVLTSNNDWKIFLYPSDVRITQNDAFLVAANGRPHFIGISPNNYNSVVHVGPNIVQATENVSLSQIVTIPLSMESPVLSFYYKLDGLAGSTLNSLQVEVDDGTPVNISEYQVVSRSWEHAWLDLSAWKGQTITLNLKLHKENGQTNVWLYLDDVSLGSALPDVWVDLPSAESLVGDTFVYNISYGNRGGGIARNNTLTVTLPAKVTFVSASVTPVSTNPLVWNIDTLDGKSEPPPIILTLAVDETAERFTTLIPQAQINTESTEPEKLNNQADGLVFLGRRVYMPFVARVK